MVDFSDNKFNLPQPTPRESKGIRNPDKDSYEITEGTKVRVLSNITSLFVGQNSEVEIDSQVAVERVYLSNGSAITVNGKISECTVELESEIVVSGEIENLSVQGRMNIINEGGRIGTLVVDSNYSEMIYLDEFDDVNIELK